MDSFAFMFSALNLALVWKDKGKLRKLGLQVSNMLKGKLLFSRMSMQWAN